MRMLMVGFFILKKCFFYNSILFVDMRKACSRDVKQKSIIPLTHPVRPEDVD